MGSPPCPFITEFTLGSDMTCQGFPFEAQSCILRELQAFIRAFRVATGEDLTIILLGGEAYDGVTAAILDESRIGCGGGCEQVTVNGVVIWEARFLPPTSVLAFTARSWEAASFRLVLGEGGVKGGSGG